MKRLIVLSAALALALAAPGYAEAAQAGKPHLFGATAPSCSPNFIQGQIPTAAQWNAAFACAFPVAGVGTNVAPILGGAANSLIGVRQGVINPVDFGAACDGSTDDSTAITNWAAAITANSRAVVPGVCVFKTPIVFPTVNNVTLDMSGGELLYEGAATTGNLVTIGTTVTSPSVCSVFFLTLTNVTIASSTAMTAGDALRLNDVCNSTISNLNLNNNAATNFFNSLHVNGGGNIKMDGYQFIASHAAEIANGDAVNGLNDLFQSDGNLSGSGIGLEIGGNVGAIYADATDVLLNGANIVVDQSQVAVPNAFAFFGPRMIIDETSGGSGIGFEDKDPGTASTGFPLIAFSGGWLSSSTNQCLKIDSTVVGLMLHYSGGTIANCASSETGSGWADNESTGANVHLDFSGTRFWAPLVAPSEPYIHNAAGAQFIAAQAVRISETAFGISSGAVSGSFVDDGGNPVYTSITTAATISAPAVSAPSGDNLSLLAASGQTAILGTGTGANSLFVQGSGAFPSTAGGLSLGTAANPWGPAFAGTINQTTVAIASLPACGSSTVATQAWVNNGIASPTYREAVSATGPATEPVYCVNTGTSFGWAY
jgi:hypothetical protein